MNNKWLFSLLSLTLLGVTFAWDPYPGFYLGDSKRVVSTGYEMGMTLTQPFENVRWAARANFGVISSPKLFFSYGLNMVYNLLPFNRVMPYVLAGVAGDMGQDSFYLGANVGAGLKYCTPDWMYSLQSRYIWYGDRGGEWLFAGILEIPVGNSKKFLDVDASGLRTYTNSPARMPEGATVDSAGNFLGVNLKINFDTDSDIVSASYQNKLMNFADYLNANPNMKVEIQGHTDSDVAPLDVNLDLSYRRAYSVAKVLTVMYGVPTEQVLVKGYGSLKPLFPNNSKYRRSMNRRIEAVLVK